ncbi:MAG: NAD-dependent isocitrate dehydrogenase [Myxococcales bacterium]|nr:NAD-dependent isocitrate dehydrogenase [Myxococcales bacterium]MCB9693703.1 NAD-dependent isocitrate dehydrogenase [Alphaproteobacteria bacterium]
MRYKVTLIEGDGIGPEVTGATAEILEAAGAPVEWERVKAGQAAFDEVGDPLPASVIASIERNRVGLKGPLGTPKGGGFRSANVSLRQGLDLYTGWRPVQSLPGVKSRYSGIDLIVLRENTQGLYAGIEHEVTPGTIVSLKLSSREAGERIARWAFEHAMQKGRRKVTVCHKRSVLPLADGAFVDAFERVGAEYPFIQQEARTLDDVAMGLVEDPHQFDVVLLQNLYGDIISDLCAGLVGGLGVVPGANVGARVAVFEAVHGTAPDIAGQGVANPLAVLLSGCLMMEYIGEHRIAARVRDAVGTVLEAGKHVTRDLGGTAGTAEFTQAVIEEL